MTTRSRAILARGGCALAALAALGGACVSLAQTPVPAELNGWQSWALHGHENHACPWLIPGRPADEERVCAWPAVLDLQVDAHGARFTQHWEAAAEGWLPLPGSTEDWPENVTLDGKAAAVVAQHGAPVVRVATGSHAIAGTFSWARRPELLAVPASVALLQLSVDGARVTLPQRSSAGVVLGAQAVAREDNRLEVRVFRLLADSLPASLTTQLQLVVAGEGREIRLPQVLPQGFIPTSVDGALAARLDPDNTLRVQVRPGEFELTIEARGPSPATEVHLGALPAPWPANEIWSFRAQDRLRVVTVDGVAALDPVQANVPPAWRELPAYRMNPGTVLHLTERSRGMSVADANQLQLQRTMWLDFSGAGYTVVDRISGRMRQGWRLEMSPPYALQSARTAAENSLLVTSGMGAGFSGVEVRDQDLDLTTVARLPRSDGALLATGWHERLSQVRGTLIVGPGYRLLAAPGTDAAPQAWLERWQLLDIFAVLLIATVAWRVLGLRLAALAIGALALTYQESGAPVWLWLNVLVALALLRAAPAGRLSRWAGAYRLLALALLLLVLVPFAITQVRLAVYPQLEASLGSGHPEQRVVEMETRTAPNRERRLLNAPTAAAPAPMAGMLSSTDTLSAKSVAEIEVTAARRVPSDYYEPGVVVQAGPGLPDWQYHVYEFSWSGPVEANATARFLISPPWMTRLWRLLGVALCVWLLLELIRKDLSSLPAWLRRGPPRAAAALLLVLLAAFGAAPRAQASTTPDPAILSDLQTRLLEPPRCAPDCAGILAAAVSVAAEELVVVLDVSALDSVGLALPGADPNWVPAVVQVDGAAVGWVFRNSRGLRYVRLTPGRHVVRLQGPVAGLDALTLSFPLAPHVIAVTAPGWDSAGITERRLVSGALELVRRRVAKESVAAAPRQEEFPAFVSVERLFHLAHDWSIQTTVERVAPKSRAFTVSLPLLAEEAVTTAGLAVSHNRVTVGLAAGEAQYQFTSLLPVSQSLELLAAPDSSHSEHWRFAVGPTWHVDFSGVPPVTAEEDANNWTFEYYPRPGERLKLDISRPPGIAGGTVAFDHVQLSTLVGKRSSDSTLVLNYRSTQGGRQVLRLPALAEVTSVTSDDVPLALRPEHDELPLSASPGRHKWTVVWHAAAGAQLLTRSPVLALGAPASNLNLSIQLPGDRWVLYAFGAGVGPTILYWGEVLLFVAVAWLLGRSRLTPLATRDWLLLGLGLSTFSWLVLLLFVAFVAVFQWQARRAPPGDRGQFNLLQVALGLLAVAALLGVVAAVPGGLLAHPDMRLAGAGSYGAFSWFIDQASAQLPRVGVLSVSLWWYKIAILAWALWLSFALTRWVRWAWQVFTRDGLWRGRAGASAPARPEPPAPAGASGGKPP